MGTFILIHKSFTGAVTKNLGQAAGIIAPEIIITDDDIAIQQRSGCFIPEGTVSLLISILLHLKGLPSLALLTPSSPAF